MEEVLVTGAVRDAGGWFRPVAVQDLFAVFNQVCEAYLRSGPVLVSVGVVEMPPRTVTATVSITGSWAGHVCLTCPTASAVDIAARMLELDPGDVGAADIDDALGELVNIVGGNVKSMLPASSNLGLPVVVVGPVDALRFPASRTSQQLTLRWNDRPMRLCVLSSVPD